MEESLLSKKRLSFQGSSFFRQRLVLSLLSARPVKITEIRSSSPFQVGLSEYEVSFIRLLDKVSNGSRFKINETGTEVTLVPGSLMGGTVAHVCHESRPLSYYLESILILAPFCKKPLRLTLKGRLQNDVTGHNSVYKLKHSAFPVMETFGLEPELEVKSRSFECSELMFTCTVKKQLLTLRSQYSEETGKVKKIRGLTYGFRVSPQMLGRIVTSAKGVFLPFINDVFITTDHVKSKSKSPGYGIVLYAETTKRIFYAADGFIGREELGKAQEQPIVSKVDLGPSGETGKKRGFSLFEEDEEDKTLAKPGKKMKMEMEDPSSSLKTSYAKSPEELGVVVAKQLLQEIATESRVDSVFQWLLLGLMSLGPKDITSAVMGPLTPFTVQFLRDLKAFFGVTFKIEDYYDALKKAAGGGNGESDDDDEEDVRRKKLFKLSCLGTGYINLNKTMV